MNRFKKYAYATIIYYLYNYILIVAFAQAVKVFIEINSPEFQFSGEEAIFSFHGKYVIMVIAYCITLFVSSALTYWIIDKPFKKALFWISFPYALGSLAYGVIVLHIVFFTEIDNKGVFYDGFIFTTLGFLIPLLSIAIPSFKTGIVSSFFKFRKRHLLWIWIPLLFYFPAVFNFVFMNIIIGVINFFDIIPSFKIIAGLKELLILFLFAVLFKLYYKPLEYALHILNKDLFWHLSKLKRSGLIFLILTGGYFLAFGAHYLISLIPF